MRKSLYLLICLFATHSLNAQTASIKGQLQDEAGAAVEYANVALYQSADSSLVKGEVSNELGIFEMRGLNAGDYFLKASFVGVDDLTQAGLKLTDGQALDLGVLAFGVASTDLEQVTVKAMRQLVEVKPDRMVFNVEGTVNSAGSDAVELLRKAPGVTVDNNDNINVLGRSGVLVYVDGKRLPLVGEELSLYLKNLPAEQIDKIDIISNPGAKYEAEGNAGIIDIRLKKNENHGTNGSISAAASRGDYWRSNANLALNHRNKNINVFGTLGVADNETCTLMSFNGYQNGANLVEHNDMRNSFQNYNYRLGVDYNLAPKHTIGFLYSGNRTDGYANDRNEISIAKAINDAQIDSFLVAKNTSDWLINPNTFNLNYSFDSGDGPSLNVDLDYGIFTSKKEINQPNTYYTDNTEAEVLSTFDTYFETPSDIDIYTFKVDYENKLWGGKVGLGTKLSRVNSDNTFLVYNVLNGESIRDDGRSNQFDYDESVYAGYITYNRAINQQINASLGLRAEQTDATGILEAFTSQQEEDPVEINYLSWFPSAGLTYTPSRIHSFALNYGRRINRPDYEILNPFNSQLSQLSYMKGNPFVRPEIVNNFELGYTFKYRYNFKIAYSITEDQITRLISPDEFDPLSSFITWDNLATQKVWSANLSAPMQLTKFWNAFFNISASHINNQAEYENGATVDVQVFSYTLYSQQTFSLPWNLKGEISGYYSGPGVWGGVFEYESSWSLNLGLQRKFLNEKLNVKLSANDIFFESGWNGVSNFNGLLSYGEGVWDSRRVGLSMSYNFGNQKVKSRKRKTGLEEEKGRLNKGN